MLYRKLKIAAPQSQDEDARPAVAHKENPADTQSERWRGRYREIPGGERSVFNVVVQRGLRRRDWGFGTERRIGQRTASLEPEWNPPVYVLKYRSLSGVYGIVTLRFE